MGQMDKQGICVFSSDNFGMSEMLSTVVLLAKMARIPSGDV